MFLSKLSCIRQIHHVDGIIAESQVPHERGKVHTRREAERASSEGEAVLRINDFVFKCLKTVCKSSFVAKYVAAYLPQNIKIRGMADAGYVGISDPSLSLPSLKFFPFLPLFLGYFFMLL